MEPDRPSDFKELQYWESFFKTRDGKPFEWYGEYADFAPLLAQHCGMASPVQPNSSLKVLVPGCGNSELSSQLYDAGFINVVNIDFSTVVIAEMLKKHMRLRPNMKWRVMDMTDTKFSDAAFDVIIDKGGLDALLGDPGQDTTHATRFLLEVGRLLVYGGLYTCITLGQSHVIEFLLSTLRHGWDISIHQVPCTSSEHRFKLRPFFVVATRRHSAACTLVTLSFDATKDVTDYEEQMPSLQKAVERENLIRSLSTEANGDVKASVPPMNMFENIVPSQRVPHILAGKGITRSSYSCVVLDAPAGPKTFQYKCAVFLVPKGRRHEWLFSSEEGQWQVVESANASRLIIVFLDTDFYSGSFEMIQDDLSPLVQDLIPLNCKVGVSIPYLTCSDGVLKRDVVEEVESSLTGAILVENVVLMDDHADSVDHQKCYRRLAFRRNPNMIQSEALLIKTPSKIPAKSKTGGKGSKSLKKKAPDKYDTSFTGDKFQVDHSFLASSYHVAMVAGFSLIATNIESWISSHEMVKVVIVGLGAGLLPMFFHKHMPFVKIQVMELDPVIGDLATRHFGFVEDERMELCIGDGLTVVSEGVDPLDGYGGRGFFHVLIIDADSQDTSSAMSGPPAEFLEESFLAAARERLCEGGMLVVNLVARAKEPHVTVPEKLKKVFDEVYSLELDEDVNRVLFALRDASGINNQDDILERACKLKELASSFTPWGNGPDIQGLAEKLRHC